VVVMRRLPTARRLSTLVERHVDVSEAIRRLAHQIASLHAAAPPSELAAEVAGLDAQRERWCANHDELAQLTHRDDVRAANDAVLEAALGYLRGRRALFDDRVRRGWARDGHGDLLADDIFCLDDGPRVLDCLEFDPRLRVGDVLADAAFFAMDLERLGRPDLGWSFLSLHRELLGDHWPESLAHHYIAYRAQVRAKVSFARADQGLPAAADAGAHLLGLAARHLAAGSVQLIVVGGLPGTGKSTVSAMLAADLDATVLRSDEIRKTLAGLPAAAHAPAVAGHGIYNSASTAATYAAMISHARRLLGLGETVVLDATWSDERNRQTVRRLAADTAADLTMIRCVAPPDVAAERMVTRRVQGTDPSDADAAIAASIADRFDNWRDAIDVPTGGSLGQSLAAARAALIPTR
jgi:uncharacterized protein